VKRLLSFSIALSFFPWLCFAQAKPSDPGEAAILKTATAYADAVNAGSLTRWAETLADDVVFQPPDQVQATGKNAVVAWAKESFFDLFKMKLDLQFDEVKLLESWAFALGHFKLATTPIQGGDTTHASGKFLSIFRRQSSGEWKYARASFSFDPTPQPAR
jgi:ketosteroid isomerase-like protein